MSIQVKNITHIYSEGLPHESKAIDDVSFDIDDGQFVGLIGHTGSGKSTLVQHLNGLLKPKSGSIFIGGKDITESGVILRDIRRKVGLVFQYPEYQLFEETVERDISFGPVYLGLEKEEIEKRVMEAMLFVGLDFEEFRARSPFELSGGQKRRVAIAGVLAMKPEVLILDEPTAGLDLNAHSAILEMIEQIHEAENNIIILISHNMNDIAAMAEKILVMEKGSLIMEGTPREIFSHRDELIGMGLAVPDITEIMNRLNEKGVHVRKNIFDVETAADEIYIALGGR